MDHSIEIWEKDKNNDYNCIYKNNFLVCHIYNILLINENQFFADDGWAIFTFLIIILIITIIH